MAPPSPSCAGHITLGPESVQACLECGHPTDSRCITCAKKYADVDPRRVETVIDCTAIARDAVDKSPVCPCCTAIHSVGHAIDDAFGEARASA